MLTPQLPTTTEPRVEQFMPENPTHQPSNPTPILVSSTTLQRWTEIPLRVHMVDSNIPFLINAFINSGATRQFIDIKFSLSKNLQTQCLPRAVLVYNVEIITLNEARYRTEIFNLIVNMRITPNVPCFMSPVLAEQL